MGCPSGVSLRRTAPTFKLIAGVRSWRLPGFKNHRIFYRVKGEVVDMLAVLEGHRDLAAVLNQR